MSWLDISDDAFDELFYPEGVDIDKLITALIKIKSNHKEIVYLKNINAWDSNYQYIQIGEQNNAKK